MAIFHGVGMAERMSSFQFDFLPAENGEAAVCLRYGTSQASRLMIYDGGSQTTGKELVAHIRNHFGTNVVDDVILSHPSSNHGAGITAVLEEMEVRQLWMHRPWTHSALIGAYVIAGCKANPDLNAVFGERMSVGYQLEKLAIERHIPLSEPFQGRQIGPFTVMSPHHDWYVYTLIPEFERLLYSRSMIDSVMPAIASLRALGLADGYCSRQRESWEIEALQEDGETCAGNESTAVLFGMIAGQGVLLTGNAGIKALSTTARYAESSRVLIPQYLKFAQLPHQADCNHVSPSVLDRLVGPKLCMPALFPRVTTFVATRDGESCPDKTVVNALIRRGALVVPTKGKPRRHAFPLRACDGWGAIEALPFSLRLQDDVKADLPSGAVLRYNSAV